MVSQPESVAPGSMRASLASEASGGKPHGSAARQACRICGGVGRLRIDVAYGDPSFGRSALCACREARQSAQRLQERRQAANLSAFRTCTFKTFDVHPVGVEEAFRLSAAFASNPAGWLLLLGPCGSGKTHLAAAVANQHLASGAAVFFTTAPDLLDSLRAAFASPERYTQCWTWVCEVELLVLDDLGAQQSTAWSTEKCVQVLTARANSALPTVITALPKALAGLDERLRSRLSDPQLVTTVLLEHATDFRLHRPAPGRRG